MTRIIKTRQDVTEDVLDIVWDVIEGWYMDVPIDWEDTLERAEKYAGGEWEFGTQWDDQAIRYVQRVMRDRKREALN